MHPECSTARRPKAAYATGASLLRRSAVPIRHESPRVNRHILPWADQLAPISGTARICLSIEQLARIFGAIQPLSTCAERSAAGLSHCSNKLLGMRKGAALRTGQRVRIRAASPIAKRDELSPDAVGTVLCSYKVRSRPGAPEKLDVRFAGDTVMWGVAADEFEPIEDKRSLA